MIFEKLGKEKERQKLIYSGIFLQNDKTIESYKISEKDFLVLMLKKVPFLLNLLLIHTQ